MSPLSHLCQSIDNQFESMVDLLEKWVCINSWSKNLPGLARMIKTLDEDFSVLQGDIITWISLPPQITIDANGKKVESPLGQALSIRKRPLAPIQVLLAGHMDTVYPPTSPFQSAKKTDPQTLSGPGVADMKGGLVIMLKALETFENLPNIENVGWEVLITPDEEIGSTGSYQIYQEAAKRNRFGLIFEPSFPDGSFASHRKGSSNLTIVARGRSSHAGRDFHMGSSAIYALSSALTKIEQLINFEKGITVNIGKIEGGGPVNIVPELAIGRLNLRAQTRQLMDETKNEIQNILASEELREGIQMELIENYCRLPKLFDTHTIELFNMIKICSESLNLPFSLKESGGVCDGNILSKEGLPTIDSLGAIGGKIHTEEEYAVLPSLVERAKLTALFLLKLAQGEFQ